MTAISHRLTRSILALTLVFCACKGTPTKDAEDAPSRVLPHPLIMAALPPTTITQQSPSGMSRVVLYTPLDYSPPVVGGSAQGPTFTLY
jgi:hypothetical protein